MMPPNTALERTGTPLGFGGRRGWFDAPVAFDRRGRVPVAQL